MAVAVQSTTDTKKPTQPMGLIGLSLIGAVFVLAAAFLLLRGIPWLWDEYLHKAITSATNKFVSTALLIAAQLTAAVLILYAGSRLGAGKQVPGLKGGIFLMIVAAFIVFFSGRAFITHLPPQRSMNFGNIVVLLFNATVLFLVVQFFRKGRFSDWAITLDQAGWFDAKTYKRTQGLRVRRLTILGILLVAGSGIWTLMNHNYLPHNVNVKVKRTAIRDGAPTAEFVEESNRMGDWVVGGKVLEPDPLPAIKPEASEDERKQLEAKREEVRLENRARPRVEGGVTLIPDLEYTIPLVLIAATLWFAWRVVNYPQFADFLIATEAEINKVSWTTRRALFRDTIVVLTSLILLTVFLFVVDVFWGWLLSRSWIAVLPTEEERERAGLVKEADKDSELETDW
ncbi:MAG TPA: preprotein translocase subunit SecE [Gemmataceae bacterium]|nr:preprotein translocase subunit SecE [Gemmataceae bacterium]